MRERPLVYGLILFAVLFSIWLINQLPEKSVSIDSNTSPIVDTVSNDTSLLSESGLNRSFQLAPGSRAVGIFSLDGERIAGFSDDKRWPIASLTKLMTAFVAFDNIKSDKRIAITKAMLDATDGSAGDFKEGETYTVADLEKALLVVSNNTAAEALSSAIGRDKFITLMNSYAVRFGLKDTRFVDPTGLSIGNQSTVQDLAKLTKYILINRPEIFNISREPVVTITDLTSGNSRELKNINQFAGQANFIGGKTGTTPEAVGNLISIFRGTKNGEGFIIVLLGTEDRFNETRKLLSAVLTK